MDLRDSIPETAGPDIGNVTKLHKRIMHVVAELGAAYTAEIAQRTPQKPDAIGSKCHDLKRMGFLTHPMLQVKHHDDRVLRRANELKAKGVESIEDVRSKTWWSLPNSIEVEDEDGNTRYFEVILIDENGVPRTPMGRKLVPEWAIENELVRPELVEMGADEASKQAYEEMERKLSMDRTLDEPISGR